MVDVSDINVLVITQLCLALERSLHHFGETENKGKREIAITMNMYAFFLMKRRNAMIM